jgi:hypothetical protein
VNHYEFGAPPCSGRTMIGGGGEGGDRNDGGKK